MPSGVYLTTRDSSIVYLVINFDWRLIVDWRLAYLAVLPAAAVVQMVAMLESSLVFSKAEPAEFILADRT